MTYIGHDQAWSEWRNALAGGVLQQQEGPHDRHIGYLFDQAAANRLGAERTDRNHREQ